METTATILELPLGLEDEERRPGTKRGMGRSIADRAVDMIRDRFGWGAVGYGSVALGFARPVPDDFRELADKAYPSHPLIYAGREPRGPCSPRTPCSRRRTGECPRASVPAPDWTVRPGSAGRVKRTAWCPRTATAL